jgi:beta-galactosidase/beta-glucuronidase
MDEKKIKRFLPLLILFFLNISVAFTNEKKISLKENWFLESSYLVKDDGKKISSPEFKPIDWYPVNIPTTVLTGLVKNGIYPNPYVGMNNMKIPDASDEFNHKYDLAKYSHLPGKRNPWADPYWFWTQFKLPKEYTGKFIWLNFEGINYRADVWLNGSLIADSRQVVGMFGNWSLDITKYANTEKTNTLAIQIHPLDYPGLPSEPQLKAFGPFGLNGGPTGDIGKNVTMHCSVGWDWIPAVRDRNMGIWQDIYVSATGPVDIRHPFVISDLLLPSTERAELKIQAEVVNLTNLSKRGILFARVSPKNFKGDGIILRREVTLEPNQAVQIQFDKKSHRELLIENPKLWWPNGQGPQNLYELELLFELDGRKSDMERQTFGIREIDSKVSMVGGWARRDFYLNGKKILLKGGAWVPDMMLNRSPEKYHHELCLFKKANLNIVRIWGGGTTPPEEFFQYCDELGLLVWHDFWITGDCQGTWDKGSPDYPFDEDVFLKNAADVVKRLRNHPSLLLWTAGNEGYPREEIYVPLRNEILAKLDGTRPFIPSSGYREPPEGWGLSWPDNQVAGTYSGGPYYWVNPKEYYKKVDNGKDWLFKNEVGIPSLPTLESLQKFIPDLTPDDEVKFPLNHIWGYHDACEGNGKYSLYDNAIRKRYGEPEDLADYIRKGQLINAENYRAIFESVNHAMDRVAGVILWKANPAWPSVVWQLYDWYLSPNAGYYYTKKACEPLHIQLNIDDFSVAVINSHLESRNNLLATVNVYSQNMERTWNKETRIGIGPNTSKVISKAEIPEEFKKNVYFVELQLRDNRNELISENFYWLAENDDFTSLQALPAVKLDIKIQKEEMNEKILCTLRLTNPSDNLAFFINPSIRKGREGGEVLPCFWSDDYFSILPAKTRKLSVEFRKSDLGGNAPYLKLEGWNIVCQLTKIN